MEPIITPTMISAALSKLLNSAASAAGTKLWESLKGILARHRHRTPDSPITAKDVATLSDELATAAAQNHDLARELAGWHQSVVGSDNVSSVVTGDANKTLTGKNFSNVTINFD